MYLNIKYSNIDGRHTLAPGHATQAVSLGRTRSAFISKQEKKKLLSAFRSYESSENKKSYLFIREFEGEKICAGIQADSNFLNKRYKAGVPEKVKKNLH